MPRETGGPSPKETGIKPEEMLTEEQKKSTTVESEKNPQVNPTEEALKEIVEDPELAETMARAVKDLRELSIKLREEVREKYDELGLHLDSEELQEVIEDFNKDGGGSLFLKKFDFSDRFPNPRDLQSSEYKKFSELRRIFSRATYYEDQASRHEDSIIRRVHHIEESEKLGMDTAPIKELLVQKILEAHRDGSWARFRETKVGRVGAKVKEKAEDAGDAFSEVVDDISDHTEEMVDDIKYFIEDIVDEIKWKIGR